MWRAERTEQLHRHLMQITEDRAGALEPRGDLVDPASGIVGQGRARRLRVNNDRVLSEVGQRPQGAPTISTLFEPVCRVARHAKTACRVFAAKGAFLAFDDVELGKNAVAPGVQWVVAQDVRSEERRVGKECRCRWWACHEKKKVERGSMDGQTM